MTLFIEAGVHPEIARSTCGESRRLATLGVVSDHPNLGAPSTSDPWLGSSWVVFLAEDPWQPMVGSQLDHPMIASNGRNYGKNEVMESDGMIKCCAISISMLQLLYWSAT